MTDSDIINALECCTGLGCDKCKFNDGEPNTCSCEWELKNAAMEVLKRQQAEIERLEGLATNMEYCANHALDEIEKEKREAIKDFAERLKAKATYLEYLLADWDELALKTVEFDEIDALVEEMEGENGRT